MNRSMTWMEEAGKAATHAWSKERSMGGGEMTPESDLVLFTKIERNVDSRSGFQ